MTRGAPRSGRRLRPRGCRDVRSACSHWSGVRRTTSSGRSGRRTTKWPGACSSTSPRRRRTWSSRSCCASLGGRSTVGRALPSYALHVSVDVAHQAHRDDGCVVLGLAEAADLAPLRIEGEEQRSLGWYAAELVGQGQRKGDVELAAVLARHDLDGRDHEVGAEAVAAIDEVAAEATRRVVGVRWAREDREQLAGVPFVVHLVIIAGDTDRRRVCAHPGSVAGHLRARGRVRRRRRPAGRGGVRRGKVRTKPAGVRHHATRPAPQGAWDRMRRCRAVTAAVTSWTPRSRRSWRTGARRCWRATDRSRELVDAAELDRMAGSVDALETVLRRHREALRVDDRHDDVRRPAGTRA